jgi:flagellar biosynthetic protein FlhB
MVARLSKIYEVVIVEEFIFDLQLFAEDSPTGQKTEEATPWRRQEARKKGQTAKSMDMNGVIVMLVGFVTIYASAGYVMDYLEKYMKLTLGNLYQGGVGIGIENGLTLSIEGLYYWIITVVPIIVACSVASILVNVVQVGVMFTPEAIKFNPGKLNPINGFKKMFGLNAVNELGKSVLKISAIIYVPYDFFVQNFSRFPGFLNHPVEITLSNVSYMTYILCLKIIFILLALSVFDYLYQKYEFEKSIKMSKYDIKQEYKQHEGDPHIKAQLRRRMMELSKNSMAQEVPKADVIITNPTHYAIALRYNQDEGDVSPKCVAKGTGKIALKIIEIGRENSVFIHQDPPMARLLFKEIETGDEIPEQLFVAVAEILAHVYQKTGRG